MSQKRPNAKHKIDRRLNLNLWGRAKSPHNKRQTGPGQHGAKRGKLSDYGVQLQAKQKLKGYYANIGERDKALEILKDLKSTDRYVSPAELPVLLIALGMKDEAFASFEKAIGVHDPKMGYLKSDPAFDPLRDDPRFKELLKNVGFPE